MTAADLEYQFYEQFFFNRDLEPYPVQEQAFAHIFRGESLLVTVPTGTGKTMMAKAAIWKALATGQTAVYTTPLRALTEEKYRELVEDFGAARVGFATGDYKVNPEAPVQVLVAEILWNRIYGDRGKAPADVVVMDEGHYFNEPERGHIWEQSIIGLHPRTQLVILSATVGEAVQFCQWVYDCRKSELALVQSNERKVPLYHEWREAYLIEVVKELARSGDVPALIFTFGREQCFERARLLKSCQRFTTDEERQRIAELADEVLLPRGLGPELRPLLLHGIGVHHAGILPRYKQLVERLTLERLLKLIVCTETISAGINLPAKRVIFPELRKYVQKKGRLLTSAEFHQMAGRAGRPQFDTEGIAIALAPEAVVQEIRKELKDAQKGRFTVDEGKVRKGAFARARSEAQRAGDVIWDEEAHQRLIAGAPAPLRSQTRITAEQILAIGLPDLEAEKLPEVEGDVPVLAPEAEPAAMHLHIGTVIRHLLLPEREKGMALRRLVHVTDNLQAMGIVDEHGVQVKGQVVNQLRGIDGLFVYFFLMNQDPSPESCRELVEFLVDHDVIQRILSRKDEDKKREWIRQRLRDRRREEPPVSWEDVEAEYEAAFPRQLQPIEELHARFVATVPHPELHGGKRPKAVWKTMETDQLSFLDFVEREHLESEEGSLFSYLARVMKVARMLAEATTLREFQELESAVRAVLVPIDPRVAEEKER